MQTQKSLSPEQIRLNQFWEWGQNCKVLAYDQSATDRILHGWGREFNAVEIDRFWEGYFTPKCRTTVLPIDIT